MTDSNFTRFAYAQEGTIGTPATSASTWALARIKGEGLNFNISNVRSEELRTDRATADLIQVGAQSAGGPQLEMSYPEEGTFIGDLIKLAMFRSWTNQQYAYNLVADTPISAASSGTNGTFTLVATAVAWKANSLIYAEGFGQAANNGLHNLLSSSSGGVLTVGTSTMVTEAVPPAGARLTVVGMQATSAGEMQLSTSNGNALISSVTDFTTLQLSVGQWIKLGGTGATYRSATAANNGWARVSVIAANKLTFDRVPTGFVGDSLGTVTLRSFFGDICKQGVTSYGWTIEKGFTAQAVPSYTVYPGCMVNTLTLNLSAAAILGGQAEFMGMAGHTVATASISPVATAATQHGIMNAVSNVANISEGGAAIGTPNFAREMSLTINNNLRERTAIGTLGSVGTGVGDAEITGNLTMYFGNKSVYEKYVNGTETSCDFRVIKDNKAVVADMPRIKFEGGQITAQGRNQDVMAQMTYRALKPVSTVTNQDYQLAFNRLWYYQD